jgi:hypothetical protein
MLQLYGGSLRGKGQRYQPFSLLSVSEKSYAFEVKKHLLSHRVKSFHMVAWRMVETIIKWWFICQHVLAITALCGSGLTVLLQLPVLFVWERMRRSKNRAYLRDAVLATGYDLAIEKRTRQRSRIYFVNRAREISSNVCYNIDEHQNGLKRRKLMKEDIIIHFQRSTFFEAISNILYRLIKCYKRRRQSI